MILSPAKMAEQIEMLFGLWIAVGPGNCVLDGGRHPLMGMGNKWQKADAVQKRLNEC